MMRVAVCLKSALDPAQPLQAAGNPPVLVPEGEPVYAAGTGGLAALELAMQLKEKWNARVTAVTAGGSEARQALASALARGADAAVHRSSERAGEIASLADAAALVPELVEADLILCGDSASGSFAGALAETLGRPLVTRVLAIQINGDALIIERSLERGNREWVFCSLPAVLAVLPHAAPPRYLSVLRLQQQPLDALRQVNAPVQIRTPALRLVEVSPARPRPRRMAAPPAGMSAAQRMSFMMGGGPAKPAGNRDKLFEGTPEQAVERIVQYLKENGLL